MRRRRGLNSAILLLLFSRLRFNSRNPSKQELHPQTDPPNAASAASFNPKTDSAIIENALDPQPLVALLELGEPSAAVEQMLLAAGPRRVGGRIDVEVKGVAFLAPRRA